MPDFPTKLLPPWMGDRVQAEAEARKTPVDLGALLAQSIAGVGVARKFRVSPRLGRVNPAGRGKDSIDNPALSLALSVQPDVIRGLADQSSMRGRGFLARFLCGIPTSKVGARRSKPPAVTAAVAAPGC